MGFTDTIKGFFGKSNDISKGYTESTSRPSIAQPYMSTDTGAKLPIFPFPLIMIYELADNIDALRIPIETLNREMFKNGFEIVERFKYKCANCSKEFKYKPIQEKELKVRNAVEAQGAIAQEEQMESETTSDAQATDKLQCDTCGSNDLQRPIPEHRKILEKLIEQPVNGNNQTIEDVARMLERDLEIADNAYMLLLKNYNLDDTTGDINWDNTEIKECLRIDPPQVAMIADSDGRIGYDDKRNKVWVCPRFEHRDRRLTTDRCERCGAEALKAIMEVNSVYSIGIPQPKRVVYGEGEVIWRAGKYRPALIYGYSPIYSVWSKAMSLSHMDEYIRKYFDKMRPPRGMLVIASRNYETFRKSWDLLEQKAIEDPYMIHPLLVESDKTGKNLAQWLDFTGSLKELEFIAVRKELRMIIGAIYGVLPLYYGEMPSGWSQEGLQVTITNRAVKWGQDILYKSFFKKIGEILGVNDWDLKLKSGEENDKLMELQTDAAELANMQQLQAMGFEISRTHTGDFKVSKDPVFTTKEMLEMQMGGGQIGEGQEKRDPERTRFQGEPQVPRSSDIGGIGQGSPSSGKGTSMSKKNFPTGITPTNYEVVKKTLQSSVDFGWTKTKTVDELRKFASMTVRQARDIVKNEFESTRRWEDGEE
jgi:DNA-directed RNA polymerase subunit RPC12/RpoP